jgi:hypothetical protein
MRDDWLIAALIPLVTTTPGLPGWCGTGAVGGETTRVPSSRRPKESALALYDYAKEQIEALRQQCHAGEERDALRELGRLLSWAQKSQSAAHIRAAIELAQSDPRVTIATEQLDTDLWALNVVNGTIDLRTGRLRKHRQKDLLTTLCPVIYDPAAKCPRWQSFVAEIFDNKRALIDFVQLLFGYCLTSHVTEQILPIFLGCGANGKSTLLNIFMTMLGDEYAVKAPRDLLMAKRADGHPAALALGECARIIGLSPRPTRQSWSPTTSPASEAPTMPSGVAFGWCRSRSQSQTIARTRTSSSVSRASCRASSTGVYWDAFVGGRRDSANPRRSGSPRQPTALARMSLASS